MPEISIIIPVYNSEKYLRQCLDSVLNQSFSDFECICVNDGSTDNSLLILQEYANKDKRFKIIDKQNEGVSIARNTGIENAFGEYITFIDSDDWVEIAYLAKLYNFIVDKKIDYVVCNLKLYHTTSGIFQTDSNVRKLSKLYKKLVDQEFKNKKKYF